MSAESKFPLLTQISLRRLLEVGALKPDNYHSCSAWITTTPIDLHSRHPEIQEQDFLKLGLDANRGQWDLISLSLVLNFVPNATDRGEFTSFRTSFLDSAAPGRMLRLAYDFLVFDGYLFLAVCKFVALIRLIQHCSFLFHV